MGWDTGVVFGSNHGSNFLVLSKTAHCAGLGTVAKPVLLGFAIDDLTVVRVATGIPLNAGFETGTLARSFACSGRLFSQSDVHLPFFASALRLFVDAANFCIDALTRSYCASSISLTCANNSANSSVLA